MDPINISGNLGAALKKKFPMPSGRREQALGVILLGLAMTIGAGADPVADTVAEWTQETAPGVLVVVHPKRGQINQRLVGSYVFADATGTRHVARSRRARMARGDVPKTLTVVWPTGRPHEARAVGEYGWQWLPFGLGVLVLALGLAMRLLPPATSVAPKPPLVRPVIAPSPPKRADIGTGGVEPGLARRLADRPAGGPSTGSSTSDPDA